MQNLDAIFTMYATFQLQEDATNYLYVKMMGGKLKLKEGVIPHIFPGNEEQVSQEDLLRLLEENLSG